MHLIRWEDFGMFICRCTVVFPLITLVVCGCSTLRQYPSQAADFYGDYRSGHWESASTKIRKAGAKRQRSRDALVWHLEEGAVLRSAGRLEDSIRCFEKAEAIIDDFDNRAAVSARAIGSETASAISNPKAIPYRGYAHDRIMLNTFKALNYIELGRLESARVEFRRAYERQKQAVERYRKELEKEMAKARSRNIDVAGVQGQLSRQGLLGAGGNRNEDLTAYADYVNPATVYLEALLLIATADGGSDLERARKNFERVQGMIGDNSFINDDLNLVDGMLAGQPIKPVVYVIFENGLAPVRREVRIDIPIGGEDIFYVGAAFPQLERQHASVGNLLALTDRQTLASTRLLADMDSIITAEFDHNLRILIARTLVASTVKAVAQKQLQSEFGEVAKLGAAIYAAVTNQADLRGWLTLPKQFQFARFARPDESQIYLSTSNGFDKIPVALPNAAITLIYVKSVTKSGVNYVKVTELKS